VHVFFEVVTACTCSRRAPVYPPSAVMIEVGHSLGSMRPVGPIQPVQPSDAMQTFLLPAAPSAGHALGTRSSQHHGLLCHPLQRNCFQCS
jgi:hypothetical protein